MSMIHRRTIFGIAGLMRRLPAAVPLLLLGILLPAMVSAQSFTVAPKGDYGNVTVMEVSGNYDALMPDGTPNTAPRTLIAKEFYKTHKDEYDFVVLFTNFDFAMPLPGAKAFYTGVKNDIQGIGTAQYDATDQYGSSGQLQGVIEMGNIAGLASDPTTTGFEDTVALLTHQFMHRWGANVSFYDASGTKSSALVSSDGNRHWSYLLDTNGSTLYGNHWRDNGNGTFTSLEPDSGALSGLGRIFSPLDLYLMGLSGQEQVPDMLLIENPAVDSSQSPAVGIVINGATKHISINDIIAAEGERVPGVAASQKTFKAAFIYAVASGSFPDTGLLGIEAVRNGWVGRYSVLTDGKAIMQVTPIPIDGPLPANPGVPVPVITPRTMPPDINQGIIWLTGRQQMDGHWEDSVLTSQRDTAETLMALQYFSAAQQNYLNGLAWLSTASSGNTDYTARAVQSLGASGRDVSLPVGRLVSDQNADGGWGSRINFMSDPADTGLALEALSSAGFADSAVIAKAIGYLSTIQNADGGWSAALDQGSSIQPTATVLAALKAFRSAYQLESIISFGIAWLTQKQNADGGFGINGSTVYDTAPALLVLREPGVSPAILNKGIVYLNNSQSATGSWNESAYQTALAVQALWLASADPDLVVVSSGITLTPSTVTSIPADIAITVVISNIGNTGVPQATVALYDGDPASGKKVSEQSVAFPAQTATTVTFSAEVNDNIDHTYFVSVDPADLVYETNETNNIAGKTLSVKVPPAVKIISPIAGEIPNKTPSLLYEVSDGTVTVKVDGGSVAKVSGDLLGPFLDGSHTVRVEATDSRGNMGSAEVAFTVIANGPVGGTGATEQPYATLLTKRITTLGNVVADPKGNIIVIWRTSIDKYDSSGNWIGPTTLMPSGVLAYYGAADSCSNVYAAGNAGNYGTYNISLTKIDSAGSIASGWPKIWGSIQSDSSSGVTVDAAGVVSVTGYAGGPIDGAYEINNTDGIFLTKYDGNGTQTVNRQYLGSAGKDLVADSSGNIYIAGQRGGRFFLGKYDRSGNELWASQPPEVSGLGSIYLFLAIDPLRNLFVADYDGSVAKFDSSGNLLWVRNIIASPAQNLSSAYTHINDIVADKHGNIYAVGDTNGNFDGYVNAGLTDLFVEKYDGQGNNLWTRQIGSSSYDYGYSIAIDESGYLYVAASGNLDGSGSLNSFLLKLGPSGPDTTKPMGTIYYMQSASGCKQTTYSRGMVTTRLGTSKGSCTGADTAKIRFSGGPVNLLLAYAANGGYAKDTLVKGLPEGNFLSFLAQSSNGTGLVQLVEVNPSDGTVVSTLSSLSVPLTAGQLGYAGDLSALSGIVTAGKTFGIMLSMSTDLRSYNEVLWGNAQNCPLGSTQYITVTETAVETQPPSSTITSPNQGQILGGAYGVISGTAGDGTGSGVALVEVSTDGGVTWGAGTDTSGNSSWSSWSYPWVLPADGSYTIRSRAKDKDGNVEMPSAGITIVVDNNPPLITISPVKTPTVLASQTVSGTRESGALIAVTVDTSAVAGAVIYPTATTWSCTITGLTEGTNTITVTATDPAGLTSRATATIAYAYEPPPAISLTPTDIMDDYQETVKVVINSLPAAGAEILAELLIDSNQNGIVDPGESVIQSFKVTDGTTSINPNVQGDEDGFADKTITTTLNYFNTHDWPHAPGAYVFRVTAESGSAYAPLVVHAVSRTQTVSGSVSDGTTPLPGATIKLVDKWGRDMAYVIADFAGHYVINVRESGEYYAVPSAMGHVFDKSSSSLLVLGPGQAVTGHDLTMAAGTYHVTGIVKDASTSAGIGGVWVLAEDPQYVGGTLTNEDGSYDVLLPSGQYNIASPGNSLQNPSYQGYVGYGLRKTSVTVAGNGTATDIVLPRSDVLACGRVVDNIGSGVPGLSVQGKIPSSVNTDEPTAIAVTNGAGDYCLGLYSADNWDLSLMTDAAQISGYMGSMIKGFSTSVGPLSGNTINVNAVNSWITGSVKNSSNAPLSEIDVKVRNTDSTILTEGKTASDGTYRLGVFEGTWYVKAYPEAQGYAASAEQSVTVSNGQSATVNFTANPAMTNTIAILKAVYTARTKSLLVQATSNYGASAALQLQGYGPMTWDAKKSSWTLTVSNLTSAPSTVTISGPEGSRSSAVTVK